MRRQEDTRWQEEARLEKTGRLESLQESRESLLIPEANLSQDHVTKAIDHHYLGKRLHQVISQLPPTQQYMTGSAV